MKNQLCKLIFHKAICVEASQIAWCAGANWRFAPRSSRYSASEWRVLWNILNRLKKDST